MQEAWSSLFLICAVQWRIISDDWLLDYLEEHEDKFSEREVYLLRELADLLADLDQLDLDEKEMSCLLFIALFNPCRFLIFFFNVVGLKPLSTRIFTVFGHSSLEDRVLHKEAWVAKQKGQIFMAR